MLIIVGVAALLADVPKNSFGESLYDSLGLLLVFLNIPTAPTIFVDGLILSMLGWQGWSVFLLIVPSVWATWYGIIRFLEWRSFARQMPSIRVN